jgi:AcrR family transcriptional regulator
MKRTHRDTGQRERVLQAVVDVVAERGLSDTRVVDVADRAGMTKSHVLYYVGTRARMLLEALSWIEESLSRQTSEAIAGVEDPVDRVRLLLELAVATGVDDARWVLWLEAWENSPRDPEVAKVQESLAAEWIDLLADELRRGQDSGAFGDFDADEVAEFLSVLNDGLAIQVINGSAGFDHDKALAMLWAEVEARVLAGSPRT